ncbi:hypothetical protein T12_14710 [Trichinella patagoniensis]|uniref:Uncharacterized protein n=1 Tax=Trichinella patagoniensis TaxID=990121 RepID=A0A0V0ZIC4_9BILA|nr:hypothetical protein T12_14710 [Trichinella patagoniensis]
MKVVDSTTATATVCCFFLDEILFLDTPVFQAPCIIVVVSNYFFCFAFNKRLVQEFKGNYFQNISRKDLLQLKIMCCINDEQFGDD